MSKHSQCRTLTKMRESVMLNKYSAIALAVLCSTSQSAEALSINFDYSYDGGFFSGGNIIRRSTLTAAGNTLGSLLTDSLTSITSGGGNQFNASFSRPDTGSIFTLTNYNVASNALTIFVGGRALTGTTLGSSGPGGFSASGTSIFLATVEQRGQAGITTGTKATDFAPWGGSIVFNSSSNWYFDSNTATTESFNGNDFYSVALHELAHVLGFGTSDVWNNLIAASNFTGTNSKIAYGGKVPLSPNPGHWQEGTQSIVSGLAQEAAMDPSLLTGTRKVYTALDLAALKDIGWQVGVAAVPLPSAAWLFLSAILGITGIARKRQNRRVIS